MDSETTLATEIQAAGEKAKYDAACKRLLSEKSILAWIMKSCLEEYRDCTIVEIAEKYIEGQPSVDSVPVSPDETNPVILGMCTEDASITEGTVTYDIRFSAYAPTTGEPIRLIINVEAQNYTTGYPLLKRAIYYCSRMISAQYGTEFTHSHYERIRKVYSIWVCASPPQDHQNTITRYRMTEENLVGSVKEELKKYDLITVVMLCLGDPDGLEQDSILRLLSVLLSDETKKEKKKQILRDDFSIPMTETLERSLTTVCNLSEGVEARGIAKGLVQGRAEGRAEGYVDSIRNLMANTSWSADQAMTALGVPAGDRQKYLELLAKQ